MSLYTFSGLERYLDQQGFPKAGSGTFQLLKRNLAQGMQRGDIVIRPDGIFCTINGHEYKGYIFNQTPNIAKYPLPKFHAADCEIVARRHILKGDYIFTTSENVQLFDSGQGGCPYPKLGVSTVLELCGYCRQLIGAHNDNILDTEDFHAMLLEQYGAAAEPEARLIDVFGYTPDFSKISKKIRELRLYQCESCQLDLSASSDRRFLHVHHLNGHKTDNRPQNLQCLCIRCHAVVDLRHETNFATRNQKREVEAFNRKFPQR